MAKIKKVESAAVKNRRLFLEKSLTENRHLIRTNGLYNVERSKIFKKITDDVSMESLKYDLRHMVMSLEYDRTIEVLGTTKKIYERTATGSIVITELIKALDKLFKITDKHVKNDLTSVTETLGRLKVNDPVRIKIFGLSNSLLTSVLELFVRYENLLNMISLNTEPYLRPMTVVVSELSDLGLLSKEETRVLKTFNNIRNTLTHNLSVTNMPKFYLDGHYIFIKAVILEAKTTMHTIIKRSIRRSELGLIITTLKHNRLSSDELKALTVDEIDDLIISVKEEDILTNVRDPLVDCGGSFLLSFIESENSE